ncbi:MAG: hypothetical protein D6808_07415 [Candidatus Dadabacteria bacterium]|nr:MAG: hypothetical protein D6808_07415 [Candidatus Dadabacteria bacterium]
MAEGTVFCFWETVGMFDIPKNFKLCFSSEEISDAVRRLGEEISKWASQIWEDSHTDIVAVPVLRGGIFFFADLVRSIESSVEIAPAKAWAYVEFERFKQREKVKVDISNVPAKGRRVLLVDDICDSGRTLKALKEEFLNAGALEVRAAVLIKRIVEDGAFEPDWIGFEYKGAEWFVGYGMEDSERWRNLPSVYIIQQTQEG